MKQTVRCGCSPHVTLVLNFSILAGVDVSVDWCIDSMGFTTSTFMLGTLRQASDIMYGSNPIGLGRTTLGHKYLQDQGGQLKFSSS